MKYTIKQVNDFSLEEYKEIFSNIIEHGPSFPKCLYLKSPFQSTNDLILTLYEYLENLENEEKRSMLTYYPDLCIELERMSAKNKEGITHLNSISDEEMQYIRELNTRYRKKFGFPFVVCAWNNNYKSISRILMERLNYSQDEEIENGMGEVKKLSTLRILKLIDDNRYS